MGKAQSSVYFEEEDLIGLGSALQLTPKDIFLQIDIINGCNQIFVIYNNYINWAKIISVSKNMDTLLLKQYQIHLILYFLTITNIKLVKNYMLQVFLI